MCFGIYPNGPVRRTAEHGVVVWARVGGASLAIEGKFSTEGLLTLTAGEDMATALAKALVDGLEAEGVEHIWSKLNKANNRRDYREAAPDGWLFQIDPEGFQKRTAARKRRRRGSQEGQLMLFGEG